MRQILPITSVLAAGLLLSGSLPAQQRSSAKPPIASPTAQVQLQADLQRLAAAAQAQLLSLPSFTCQETALSEVLREGRVIMKVKVRGTVRVLRKPNGVFDETFTYKRFHLLIFPTVLPYYVRGGFDSALTYFLPSAQGCYRYTLSPDPGRIDFVSRTNPDPGYGCKDHGLTGFALLDAAGDVTHIERTIPEAVARPLKLTPFAAVDLGPVDLNGQVYLLSQHITATDTLGYYGQGHFEATYSGCKLFTATVTIGPATLVPSQP